MDDTKIDPLLWVGVDLDGTLATYPPPVGIPIGEPIAPMVERVKALLTAGWKVKIFTARANYPVYHSLIQDWLENAGLPRLEVTATKDINMIEFWDDRARQVEFNTGRLLSPTDQYLDLSVIDHPA